ncbi:hypothetical protein KMZ29_12785 [Bradyrhizobium sediminis]|uniref:Uncharacterized protein n=1 Tax=Bradyrhizobium sediminis TaxID=2840469 RepID=A0A975NJ30_9BRAD|nr:hypothetical protein [Bradyrhizobium sediminis]QWG15456.1 hypothetical protein KMZ29_12785 [Bradyrhizobium sediminis]
MHTSFTMNADASLREAENRLANQRRRFARKSGFGERRSGAKPVSMKIFLLPKFATQSPRNPLSAVFVDSQ